MLKELILSLVTPAGPSGYEQHIRAAVQALAAPHADEIRTDALGSLIVRKGAPGAGLRLMIAAHLDEIGLIVTHLDANGFARFTNLGGVSPRNCIGGRVRFLNGVQGVIGVEPLDSGKTPALENLYIDTGAASAAASGIQPGDIAAFERPFLDLGSRVVSKALDDRIGVAVALETLRRLGDPPHEIYFVFTAQEEVGTRGAGASAYHLNPGLGLAVDVTGTGDTPKARKMAVALGRGPAIKVRDSGMIADPRVVAWMVRTAQAAGLPYQLEILEGGTTDARAIQLAGSGVPAGCLSIPCRYIHTPSEMVDLADVENAVNLLTALLSNPIEL